MGERDQEFKGRVAMVTGGSRGIGRAVCLALAKEGADIALNYVANADAAKQTQSDVEALGARCTIHQTDVADAAGVEAMVKEIGAVDLLVTAAGIAHVGDHTEIDVDLWRRIMTGQCRRYLPTGDGGEGWHDRARFRPNRLHRLDRRPSAGGRECCPIAPPKPR